MDVVGLLVFISLFCEEPCTVAEKITDHFQHCDKLILMNDLRTSGSRLIFVVTVICSFVILRDRSFFWSAFGVMSTMQD